MEDYPEELRTPPVGLIALVGCPEHHSLITTHLLSEQPPSNTLALPDIAKISLLLSSADKSSLPPPDPSSSPTAGILKRDWLHKHRTRVPAVVAALFISDHVSGDPAQWLQLCSDLENLKAVIRPKNIKLAVVVVHSSSDDISEDRMIALRKRAELDSKYLVVFNPADSSQLEQSLNKLGSTFAELANTYYRDEGRRIKTRVERKSFNSIELNIRYCFKVAVSAEFRRDWVEALRFYEDAYYTLREMIGTANRLPVIQRLIEIKTVAEQLHFKISTLLLHGGKVIEAVTWFHQHFASYRKLLGPAEAIFLHWEWVSRQFLVFAELLETSSKTIHSNSSPALGTSERSLTEWKFQPAYYYQLAGHYLKEKRTSFELALSMLQNADEIDGSAESVTPAIYVGQFARLLEQGDAFVMQPLTDEEYTRYAIAEAKRFQDSFEIIALLKRSYESYTNLKAQRMASRCGFQMAQEYFAMGDLNNAKQLLDVIAALYRKEGWVTLLWEVLGFLRECSRKRGIVKEFIEYSLEMAALPVSPCTGVQSFRTKECGPAGPASLAQRENIHNEVFQLVSGEIGAVSVGDSTDLKVNRDSPLHLEIDLVSPLRMALLASVAFHEQIIKPGVPALITLSLLSQLPLTVDLDQLEVQFNQSECNFIIINSQKPPSAEISTSQQGRHVESAPSLALVTNKWLRLTYEIKSEQSGKLECIYVIAKMGPHFTICCRAESPASMDDLPLWKFEDRVETFPTKDPVLAFSGQKLAQVEEPDPQVDLVLGATGPALVGECFVVPVTVASKGHDIFSGELKINLVDVRGGGLFSPREAEPFSMDNHHVELLGVNGPEGEDESTGGYDKIKKIQQSFGLVSLPIMKDGESWSCKLEIKWHRPKPIMLFVSLSYFPDSNEMTSQKIHVHKNLQIEGKSAVLISHHFMLPFRQDPLLLSKLKPASSSDQGTSLPLNETSIVLASAKNCSEVPLQLQSMSIEMDDDVERSFTLQPSSEDLLGPAYLVPGEEFKKVFTIIPEVESSNLNLGSVSLRWRRNLQNKDRSSSAAEAWVLTRHKLPDVNVELSPLVLTVDCPPYAILGDPFTYSVKIRNQTQLLQEVKFSLADAQSFVLSGSHSDTVFVLPKSEHVLGYKIVPLASGLQQLPRVTVTSVRYSAVFQLSNAASTVFVFPTKPHFKTADVGDKGIESVVAE
ncbi:trafficking protein particle complex subunit 11 isoform X2 [Manihot esculenta]|uniref:Trafficking protein particle complex subunit 11 domain-containing protein n=1 Tax=Manihot esculenta TaxID=3983 RepID=A0A2C9WEK3_MANES|nr:trafficking protein particle complex subunit 11 isoform X2 [Manihot esculenta]OAY57698.1 hypothetical protein MANES_02G116600v8 [Manihot esculenta]